LSLQKQVLREFPDELRGDVSLHLHREILSLPIFETAPQGCLKLLSRHIKTNFCAPGEYLLHDGDALSYIYLVCNGSMEVLQNCMVVAILGKGDLVGCDIPSTLTSEALIKSSGDIKALTYCDLKSIHITGLLDVLKLYPEFAETFCNEIVHDLTFNLREGYGNDHDSLLHIPCSISEDEDNEEIKVEDEEDEDKDNDDEACNASESGSTHSSPSIGFKPSNQSGNQNQWTMNDNFLGVNNLISNQTSKPKCITNKGLISERGKEAHDPNQPSIEKIDSQLNLVSQDVNKLTNDIKLILSFIKKLDEIKALNYQKLSRAESISYSTIKDSSCYNHGKIKSNTRFNSIDDSFAKVTSSTQTEKFLLDKLITKLTDSGSPPPNSGYSSSSSNEDKVRYMINLHPTRTEDTESISEETMSKALLTVQNLNLNKDTSLVKGAKNSWNLPFSDNQLSPPTSKPAATLPSSNLTTQSESQFAINIDNNATTRTRNIKRNLSTEL